VPAALQQLGSFGLQRVEHSMCSRRTARSRRARTAGLRFRQIRENDFPLGSLLARDEEVGKLEGLTHHFKRLGRSAGPSPGRTIDRAFTKAELADCEAGTAPTEMPECPLAAVLSGQGELQSPE
jgi:hypothetical protein